ncbi:MAG: NAD(P)H-hydrate dehydratase [Hydrogenophaga sp.]|uniref:NAD(P)H-hydrate dehydratase n=1 Tax=Hydrogenophaga sp. TaxID=1904254 RepID=UPI002620AE27|nr:NAD(P)H-hydrate dehydratase [Hydrogenophaga sp.]MDM7943428.1 NAD(P)H-hydrate dehydratase [Hydrogenophaga sp.]
MRSIDSHQREALFDTAGTRQLEQVAQAALPAHTLMARAGLAVARLARALAPHAQCIWVACGPGNNGGDGLVAAMHLHRWAAGSNSGLRVIVTHAVDGHAGEEALPADARWALAEARSAGVVFQPDAPESFDLAIDALLGIGAGRPLQGRLASWAMGLRTTDAPVLCVDLPSGLQADTGQLAPIEEASAVRAHRAGPRHTLALLTLKPGLFTHQGRDAAGRVWLDDLGVRPSASVAPTAWLAGRAAPGATRADKAHASHKGSFGDVVVIGGQGIATSGAGMTGAAVLAARAALHGGAGRVFVGLLESGAANETRWDPVCPELMFRRPQTLADEAWVERACVVCGCGGGLSVAAVLPRWMAAATLVLDADALNAVASDTALQTLLAQRTSTAQVTVLTPHPLEAARLLGCSTAQVMADRLRAARTLAERFGVICVLKGSGTVLAAPNRVPMINPTGNAALSTAGTGDVLAGMIGAALAGSPAPGQGTLDRVAGAVFQHGWLADHWPADGQSPGVPAGLVAGELARRVRPFD